MRHKDTIWANVIFMFILILYLNFYKLYSITQPGTEEDPYSRAAFSASSTIILYGLLLASVMLIFHVVFQRKNEDLSQYHVTRCISTLICCVAVISLVQITGPGKECNHKLVMVLVQVEATKLIVDVLICSSGVLMN